MHIQHSQTANAAFHVEVSEPWRDHDGHVFSPSLNVWPLGQSTGDFWSFSREEAIAAIAALQRGVDEVDALFGSA